MKKGYKKLFGSVTDYTEEGKTVKRYPIWTHYAYKGFPPTLEITITDLPPIPKDCHRSISITFGAILRGLKMALYDNKY